MSKKAKTNSTQFGAPAAIIIGDGWAALAAVGFMVQKIREESLASGEPARQGVVWVSGTGAHMQSAVPGMEAGPAVELWQRLAQGFGIQTGEAVTGSFLREFRNKAFRQPLWTKAPTPESRRDVLNEELWGPERRLAPLWEARFDLTLNELEQRIRALLIGESEEGLPWRNLVRRIEGLPVSSFRIEGEQVKSVTLASGEELGCETILFADRWTALPGVLGLPKNLPFIRRRDPASTLQATFTHGTPMGVGLMEGFFGSLHKEVGEEMERHVWGHFASDGTQSFWTLCLMGDEAEDNHQIAKKFRRLKSGLEKMFSGESWLPEGITEFTKNVTSEQVRFQEAVIFAEGEEVQKPVTLPHTQGLLFLTDGYGPSCAMNQVALALNLPLAQVAMAEDSEGVTASQGSDAKSENMDTAGTPASQD